MNCSADVANLLHHLLNEDINKSTILLRKLYKKWICFGWKVSHVSSTTLSSINDKIIWPLLILKDFNDCDKSIPHDICSFCYEIYPELPRALDKKIFYYYSQGWHNSYTPYFIDEGKNYYAWYKLGEKLFNELDDNRYQKQKNYRQKYFR